MNHIFVPVRWYKLSIEPVVGLFLALNLNRLESRVFADPGIPVFAELGIPVFADPGIPFFAVIE